MSGGRRVAVVGAGPAGFFATAALLKADPDVRVDLIDALPTPYGLVRYGVAPDHQKIKSVTRAYARTASSDRVRYLGNVWIGDDPSVAELLERYHQVVLCVGTPAARDLGIPGEGLEGSHAATHFVAWYNGHPAHQDHFFDLSARRAVVVGMGNVAVDVARVLLKGADGLAETDLARSALDVLAHSAVREVVMVGRRGLPQAAFTPAELQELLTLDDVEVVVDPADLALGPEAQAWLDTYGTKACRRNLQLLQEQAHAQRPGASRRLVLAPHRSPLRVVGDARVEGLEVAVNGLAFGGERPRPVDTGRREVLEAGLLFRAVGYRGTPLPGVPFDEARGVIPSENGRVVGPDGVVPRLYVAGWVKRGPQGVIGTNRADANETVDAMEADRATLPTDERLGLDRAASVDWAGWERIDAHEVEEGANRGRIREKVLQVDAMLDLLS